MADNMGDAVFSGQKKGQLDKSQKKWREKHPGMTGFTQKVRIKRIVSSNRIQSPMRIICSLFGLLFLGLLSCSKDDEATALQLEADLTIIREYLAAHGLSAQETSSGLHYIIEDPGSGTSYPTSQSKVTVAYIGYLPNGNVFDQSATGNPPSFFLNQVIKGWQEVIQKFRKDGKGKLLIPSGLAYGTTSPSPKVHAISFLNFDINLINIQ